MECDVWWSVLCPRGTHEAQNTWQTIRSFMDLWIPSSTHTHGLKKTKERLAWRGFSVSGGCNSCWLKTHSAPVLFISLLGGAYDLLAFYKNVSETQQIMKEMLSCDSGAKVYLGCINNERQKMLEKSQMSFGGLSVWAWHGLFGLCVNPGIHRLKDMHRT